MRESLEGMGCILRDEGGNLNCIGGANHWMGAYGGIRWNGPWTVICMMGWAMGIMVANAIFDADTE